MSCHEGKIDKERVKIEKKKVWEKKSPLERLGLPPFLNLWKGILTLGMGKSSKVWEFAYFFLFFYFYTISYRSYRRLHTRIIDFHNMQNKDILLQTVKLRLKDFMWQNQQTGISINSNKKYRAIRTEAEIGWNTGKKYYFIFQYIFCVTKK